MVARAHILPSLSLSGDSGPGARLDGSWRQLARPEKCLSSFENHAVVYFKQLVNEEPRSIRWTLATITVFQDPIPIDILNGALEAAQLVIIKLNIARRHASDKDLFIAFECENLVKFRTIDEFELDSIIGWTTTLIDLTVSTTAPILSLKEVDSQVRRSEWNDEAVLECQWHVETNESAGALAKVADVILAVSHVVLDNHMSVTYAIILVLLDYEVVVNFALGTVL